MSEEIIIKDLRDECEQVPDDLPEVGAVYPFEEFVERWGDRIVPGSGRFVEDPRERGRLVFGVQVVGSG